jgi:hypothetical protein
MAEDIILTGSSSDGFPSGFFSNSGGVEIQDAGAAGRVVVTAGTLTLSAGGAIASRTFGAGQGGDITLQVRELQLTEGAVISATSSEAGDAGRIRLTATETFLSENSAVTTSAATADGGNITLEARLVRLRDSVLTAEARGVNQQGSDGGNVTIHAGFVILDHSQVQANAFGGNGGNIVLAAEEAFLADPQTCADQACLNASSQLGVAGTIAVNTPIADLSGIVTPLPQTFTPATALLRQRCAERLREGEISSFILAGRDGVPLEPDGLLLDPLAQAPPPEESLASVGRLHRGQSDHSQSREWPGHEFASAVWDGTCGSWLEERETLPLPAH